MYSKILTYTITGSNLQFDVSISSLDSNYTLCETISGAYSDVLTLSPISGVINNLIYVKFESSASGEYIGNVSNSVSGLDSILLSVSAKLTPYPELGVIPNLLDFGELNITAEVPQSTHLIYDLRNSVGVTEYDPQTIAGSIDYWESQEPLPKTNFISVPTAFLTREENAPLLDETELVGGLPTVLFPLRNLEGGYPCSPLQNTSISGSTVSGLTLAVVTKSFTHEYTVVSPTLISIGNLNQMMSITYPYYAGGGVWDWDKFGVYVYADLANGIYVSNKPFTMATMRDAFHLIVLKLDLSGETKYLDVYIDGNLLSHNALVSDETNIFGDWSAITNIGTMESVYIGGYNDVESNYDQSWRGWMSHSFAWDVPLTDDEIMTLNEYINL